MVIYARGGSEGTAVEAARRTGIWWRAEGKHQVKTLHLRLLPLCAALDHILWINTRCLCADSRVH